jgi:ribosomal protein L37E
MKLYTENARKAVTKHPDCVEVGECRPKHRGTKDTRRWCKGRVGVPHTWEWLRDRNDAEREQRMGLVYNRITEHPVCFGCEKVDFKSRSYCALCGEPWPNLHHEMSRLVWRLRPCERCGAASFTRVRPRAHAHGFVAHGSVVS